MPISQSSQEALCALALGFAFSGLLASGFEFLVRRRLVLALLQSGGVEALAAVPVLVFSAPYLILRWVIGDARVERWPAVSVALAAMIACGWSLLSGRLVLDLAQILAGA